MKNKVLIWTLAIAGIGLAGYLLYRVAKPAAPAKKLTIGQQDIYNAGAFLKGLFSKTPLAPGAPGSGMEYPTQTTQLDYSDYENPIFSRTDLAGLGSQGS